MARAQATFLLARPTPGSLTIRLGGTWKPQSRQNSSLVSKAESALPSALPTSSTANLSAPSKPDLSRIPTFSILRSAVLGALFTQPAIIRLTLPLVKRIAESQSLLLNPDRNVVLKTVLKPFLYDQFCAGTRHSQVARTRENINRIGFAGVALCIGREIQISDKELHSTVHGSRDSEIDEWRDGNLQTLEMCQPGDWVGIKLTGAGLDTTEALMRDGELPAKFTDAFHKLCARARQKDVRLWVDAEQQAVQSGIDKTTIDFMRRYNTDGHVVIYNTLQAYLKAAPEKLRHQLSLAASEGWSLGVKLVRGAYIANDKRSLIHDTKADTDKCYNGIVRDVLSGENLGFDGSRPFPTMRLLIAGHNAESVMMAAQLSARLAEQGKLKVKPDFAQLQGMADALGCQLLQYLEETEQTGKTGWTPEQVPKVYKCLTWGSLQECMQYLLRRMVENSGASERMRDNLSAYSAELRRRLFRPFRLS